MNTILAFAIPGGVVLMVATGVFELVRQKRRRRSGAPITATYIDEYTAMFYGTKRIELDHRDSMSMMRDEEAEGAPPTMSIDLDRGIVVLRPDDGQ
ncbi:MAG TPA: DUF6191 domain-containing protein [Pseudonocardiaceae bacterium]|nr:DUF6191 domain-containing protein [Pseudonocardiaceae bacterium]